MARERWARHDRGVGLTVTPVGNDGRLARLRNVACTLGRHDKPYPELHGDAEWTVALVRRGAFNYRAAPTNRVHALRPGWLLVGQPEAGYECGHDHDGGDDCTSLAIGRAVIEDVGGALLGVPPALPPTPRVAALLERARRDDAVDVDELAYLVAEAVLEHASGTRTDAAKHPSHVARVQDAIARIEASCTEEIALADLADEVGLSPFHFLRVFRRVTGVTPHQYVVGARLRLAVQLLLDTKKPVTTIAYDAGFGDLSNFVRTFHREVGTSPGAFRRR